MYQLDVDCVSKYFGGRRILSAASLRLASGRVVLLAGRNGAGKSTLLRIAAGCLRPDSGLIRVGGLLVQKPTLARMARAGLFFLPDQQLLTPGLRAGLQMAAVARRYFTMDKIDTVRRELNIGAIDDLTPTQLSTGQLRRVTLALALLRDPAVLLADEPVRGISPIEAELMLRAMRRLAREGAAVVVSGQEVTTLADHCDEIVWCHAGTTRAFASVQAGCDDWSFQQEFLGGQYRRDAAEVEHPVTANPDPSALTGRTPY